jgi:coatomer subunit beta'
MVVLTAAWSVKFIARKGWFVVGSSDGFIHVYNYKKEMQKKTSFKAHDSDSCEYGLAIHPTQSYVLSACHTEIKLWDWDNHWFGWKCIRTFVGHSKDICSVVFNPEDYNSFASASYDGTVKVLSSLSSFSDKQNLT